MARLLTTAFLSFLFLKSLAASPPVGASSLPVIDLGYGRHQAIGFDPDSQSYNFSNIRYALPPTGDRRFRTPVPVTGRSNAINNGSIGHICPQGNPAWDLVSAEFLQAYLTGKPYNATDLLSQIPHLAQYSTPRDPRESEDCLFLDVIVPKPIFDAHASHNASSSKVPVLVWIYGGGFTSGDKNSYASPTGLLDVAQKNQKGGFIFVTLNYRLGAFGFAAGPTLHSSGGTPNAGLYDQRLALHWIQKYIHLFGGDKNRVTLIGESAGGGSIMHQITAFNNTRGPPPFQQAIAQSPGFIPVTNASSGPEKSFRAFLSSLNVSTVDEARQLPSEVLIEANRKQIALSPYGTFTYGPVVDGSFVPALPGQALLQGDFRTSLKVMAGHTSDEGLYFTNPSIATSADVDAQLKSFFSSFPNISPATLRYITQTLYPPLLDGSHGYTSHLERMASIISDFLLSCNAGYLASAFAANNHSYAYDFAVPPGLHGQDQTYTFASPADRTNPQQHGFYGKMSPVVVDALRRYITNFVVSRDPNAPDAGGENATVFPVYGREAASILLNETGVLRGVYDLRREGRCAWWQRQGVVYE